VSTFQRVVGIVTALVLIFTAVASWVGVPLRDCFGCVPGALAVLIIWQIEDRDAR
jgi:hypothetical protein